MYDLRVAPGRLSHILQAVYCEPWLIRPETHATIGRIVQAHLSGDAHSGGLALESFAEQEAAPIRRDVDGVAVISIDGVIGKRVGQLEKSSGVTNVDEVAQVFAEAHADDKIRGILLDINSPGGSVTGTPELAGAIRESQKPTVAYTDMQAASAAYWIASQAHHLVAAPTATVGSIGVYMAILDQSRAAEMQGVKVDVIKSGRLKGAGIPGTSLSDEQRAHFQAQSDFIHAGFRHAVRAGRKREIADELMEGQSYYAQQVVREGLVDRLGTIQDAMALI